MDNLQYIIEHVPAAARIEQLAEEAAELLADNDMGRAKLERWAGRVKERLEPDGV